MKEILNYILTFFFPEKIHDIKFKNGKIRALIKDPVANSWNTNTNIGFTEKSVLKYLNINFLRNIYYLGSHQGIIPIILKKFYLKNSNFICLEALKHNYEISLKNKKINGCKDIIFLNKAISIKNGYENFSLFKLNSSKTNNLLINRKVKSLTISNLIKNYKKPNMIYMDIEGMESLVIKNNINLLKKNEHILYLELHGNKILKQFNSSNNDVFKYLSKIYKNIYLINKNKLILINKNNFNITKRIYLLCASSQRLIKK